MKCQYSNVRQSCEHDVTHVVLLEPGEARAEGWQVRLREFQRESASLFVCGEHALALRVRFRTPKPKRFTPP